MQMESVEISAKSVEEALEEGLKQLGVKKDNIEMEILSEPSQGLFKFLSSKPAKVRLSVKQGPTELMQDFFKQLLDSMSLEGEISVQQQDDNIYVNINGKELGALIGKRGSTLNSLQYLANVILHRQFTFNNSRVLVDIENYRQKRKKTLEQLAYNLAQKVKRTNKTLELEPMNPQERRIVHLALKHNNDVVTYSQGEEPYRKVVISPR